MNNTVTELRDNIDVAIDAWLLAQGLTTEYIHGLDYSFLDDEINSLTVA